MVICEPIIGCCTEFWLEVPLDYTEVSIRVRITKSNNVTFEQTLLVEDGLVEIPLDIIGTDWFNPYGGPYTLQYLDPLTLNVISFPWEGQMVEGVQWNMAPGLSDITICTLDIF
jgi:hypothetical protein